MFNILYKINITEMTVVTFIENYFTYGRILFT